MCPLTVLWVVGSITLGGLIELFLIPASSPQLVKHREWYVLSCLWDGAYEKSHAQWYVLCCLWNGAYEKFQTMVCAILSVG